MLQPTYLLSKLVSFRIWESQWVLFLLVTETLENESVQKFEPKDNEIPEDDVEGALQHRLGVQHDQGGHPRLFLFIVVSLGHVNVISSSLSFSSGVVGRILTHILLIVSRWNHHEHPQYPF